jgi:transposase
LVEGSTGFDAGPTAGQVGRRLQSEDQPRASSPSAEANGAEAEKKSLHASERDTEENCRRREEFVERLGTIAPEKLIFVDESGVTTRMTRLYGRAPSGQRIHESTPEGDWQILTMLGAMSTRGIIAAMTIEAATDQDIFLGFLDEVLCPALQPDDVVIMDNLSSHKVDGVRQRIEACQAELLYLPPYSPDLNPIEKAWSKLKQILRQFKARTTDALDQAIAQALGEISPANALAWFRLCFKGV